MFMNIGRVLNVKDVISDAHNTFIKGTDRDSENETQMDILKSEFAWSDDEWVESTQMSDKHGGTGSSSVKKENSASKKPVTMHRNKQHLSVPSKDFNSSGSDDESALKSSKQRTIPKLDYNDHSDGGSDIEESFEIKIASNDDHPHHHHHH